MKEKYALLLLVPIIGLLIGYSIYNESDDLNMNQLVQTESIEQTDTVNEAKDKTDSLEQLEQPSDDIIIEEQSDDDLTEHQNETHHETHHETPTDPLDEDVLEEEQDVIEDDLKEDEVIIEKEEAIVDVLDVYDVLYQTPSEHSVTAVVDKTYYLSSTYVPQDLRVINVAYSNNETGPSQTMLRDVAASAVETMFADARRQGIILLARSGYRSYATQVSLYESYVARDGQALADTYSARAGHSEHQTGLAIDITADSVNRALTTSFGETIEGIWLEENAHHYGFILSYPSGKETQTGYQYEPWHFRYVGKDVATIIYEHDWLLRQYAVSVGAIASHE